MPIKKYFIDDKQFLHIQTPVVSYILGFLWADGYVNKYSISTTIKTSDFKNINSIFQKTGNWGFYHRKRFSKKSKKFYESSTIYISSKEISKFLIHNDFKIKSKTSPNKILSLIPENLQNHFFRGYVDGDGSFSFYGKKQIKFNITSTINQDWYFIEKLFEKLKINSYHIFKYDRKSGISSMITISNKWDIIKLGEYLYSSSECKLQRKYSKYLQIKNSDVKKSKPLWTNEDKIFLLQNYKAEGVNFCCEKLNRSKTSIYGEYHKLIKET